MKWPSGCEVFTVNEINASGQPYNKTKYACLYANHGVCH